MQDEFVTVYGNMAWFRVAEQPRYSETMPQEIMQAKALWDEDSEGNSEKIIQLVEPFVGGLFVADNLRGWRDFLSEETFGEFEARRLRVVGVDFSQSPIPLCKVEGWFDLPLKGGVSRSDFECWLEENFPGELFSAISFYWEIDAPSLEDLDLTVGDHMGAEALVVDTHA